MRTGGAKKREKKAGTRVAVVDDTRAAAPQGLPLRAAAAPPRCSARTLVVKSVKLALASACMRPQATGAAAAPPRCVRTLSKVSKAVA